MLLYTSKVDLPSATAFAMASTSSLRFWRRLFTSSEALRDSPSVHKVLTLLVEVFPSADRIVASEGVAAKAIDLTIT